VKVNKKNRRVHMLRKLRSDMKKDESDPSRLSKWLKLMESKKQLFTLEDEIDKLTKALRSSKGKKS